VNALEKWFCGSGFWRYVTQGQLLPWLLQGADLGEHVLELGAGRGPATLELGRLSPRVTSLEYDAQSASALEKHTRHLQVRVIQGDASSLPFSSGSFSSAIAILMLHHLKSRELQDHALAEIFRVLRPGGVFLGAEIPDRWTHRIGHIASTFVPMEPRSAIARLTAAGFSHVSVSSRSGGFRMQAQSR